VLEILAVGATAVDEELDGVEVEVESVLVAVEDDERLSSG
jgi:hypothetical protein